MYCHIAGCGILDRKMGGEALVKWKGLCTGIPDFLPFCNRRNGFSSSSFLLSYRSFCCCIILPIRPVKLQNKDKRLRWSCWDKFLSTILYVESYQINNCSLYFFYDALRSYSPPQRHRPRLHPLPVRPFSFSSSSSSETSPTVASFAVFFPQAAVIVMPPQLHPS